MKTGSGLFFLGFFMFLGATFLARAELINIDVNVCENREIKPPHIDQ